MPWSRTQGLASIWSLAVAGSDMQGWADLCGCMHGLTPCTSPMLGPTPTVASGLVVLLI